MLLHISEQSAETLQEQIIGQLRARILSGDLEPDHPLPSIRALAKTLKVSVITVQRAYEQLLNEDIIYARRGKGFFVASMQQSDKSALAQQRFSDQLVSIIQTARGDGLADDEILQIFNRVLQSGGNNGDS
ncbi:MAG: GntR family transcriptional regulator [Pseudomonadales bacterium]|nr:GntR family transcriptional regulator [Pseudomonadales bacterium]